jgi:ABC-2 type transport system permease protein
VLVSQSLFLMLLGVLQISVMLAFAGLVFGVRVVGSWPGLVCVVVAGAAAAAGFGLCIAALFNTERQARPVAILVILVSSALGGSWWPLFITPQFMQNLASVTLTKWAVGGIEGALWRGFDFGQMLAPAGVLAGMAVALFGFAWWRFKYE